MSHCLHNNDQLVDGPSQYRRACSTLNSFADGLIQKAVERSSQSAKQHDEQESVADFALVDSLVEEFKDPVMVRDLVMDLFIAGQNMTGTIAAWVFAQLERNPVVFRDLRREIIDMFGTEHNPKAPIIWDNLRACTQLQHVIHETLRMYPLLANIGRNAKRDTVLPRGGGPDGTQPIAVPRGTSLTCNVYLMHRSQEDWNEDAWEFKPSRWAGRKFGPEYAPFGAGPRICIGRVSSFVTSFLNQMLIFFIRTISHNRAVIPDSSHAPALLRNQGSGRAG